MSALKNVSQNLIKSLALRYDPVGAILYKDGEPIPAEVPFTKKAFKSYCRAPFPCREIDISAPFRYVGRHEL